MGFLGWEEEAEAEVSGMAEAKGTWNRLREKKLKGAGEATAAVVIWFSGSEALELDGTESWPGGAGFPEMGLDSEDTGRVVKGPDLHLFHGKGMTVALKPALEFFSEVVEDEGVGIFE